MYEYMCIHRDGKPSNCLTSVPLCFTWNRLANSKGTYVDVFILTHYCYYSTAQFKLDIHMTCVSLAEIRLMFMSWLRVHKRVSYSLWQTIIGGMPYYLSRVSLCKLSGRLISHLHLTSWVTWCGFLQFTNNTIYASVLI